MRDKLFSGALCALICLLPSCQTEKPVGGWMTAAVAKPGVVNAAQAAVRIKKDVAVEQGDRAATLTLLKVLSAEEQVVSGMNYRLMMLVSEGGKERTAEAGVWWQAWNKDEPYKLTDWQWRP